MKFIQRNAFQIVAWIGILILCYLVFLIDNRQDERHELACKAGHAAWVKLTGRADITYEEWKVMRDLRILPK